MIEEGMEIYWPKMPNAVVFTVTENWPGISTVLLTGDNGERREWKRAELEDTLQRGFAVLYSGVPRKARVKLAWVDGKSADFRHMFSAEIDGATFHISYTTFSQELVGVVNEEGRLIRRRSVRDRAAALIAERTR